VNYFELYPGDYLRDTTRLTLTEHGAYLRLLMAYYAEEEPLPTDESELFVIVSAVSAADKTAVRKVADRFFPVGQDGMRHNSRGDEEITKARRRIEAAQTNGGKGGRPKKPKPNPNKTHWKPAGFLMGSENPAFQKPKQNPSETHSGEALHTPHAIPKAAIGNSSASADISQGETLEARACRLMREVGCVRVNQMHVDLIAAIAEWITPETLAATAAEAVEKGKGNPFEWAIATARGRAADGGRNGTRGASGSESLCERAERLCREGDERERLAAIG